jgi:gamma-glutamylcyclotransferase
VYTGIGDDTVWGVVFRISVSDKPALDKAEGLGKGYFERRVNVFWTDGQKYPAFANVAESSHIDDVLKPYSWYKRFVIEGANQHELPAEYIRAIERMPADEDPDVERDALNRKIRC